MEPQHKHTGVIKRDQVRLAEQAGGARTPRAAGAEPARTTPVRLVQLDEHTQAIEFTCACGEVSLIEIQSEKKS